MAIYHYHREIGKRHEGKNAVFAVAYIRGEKRTCHSTGESIDYSGKKDVIYSNCFLPADAPEWATKLRHSQIQNAEGKYEFDVTGFNFSDYTWNQLELTEKHPRAQLYFHDDMAIPIELNQEAAIELVKKFVAEKLAVNGIFCDASIHWETDNPHAHVVMPLRHLTPEGFSNKLRFTQKELSHLVKDIRASWADYTNQMLKELGIDARIDHRSHQARGLMLKPTRKVGKATHMKGSEHQAIRIAQNQLIRAENYEKIKNNPAALTTKLTQEHQQLTDQDVKTELSKYVVNEQVLEKIRQAEDCSQEKLVREVIELFKSEHGVFNERELKQAILEKVESKDDYQAILKAVTSSQELIHLGLGDDGRHHYVTQSAFKLETDLSAMTEQLSRKSSFLVSDEIVKQVAQAFALNDDQVRALKQVTQGGNLALVVGVAGSGKTYMLKAAHEVWKQAGYRVHGIAFSGRAASGLEQDSGIKSKTIHRFLKGVESGYLQLGHKDIVVMDEMGMTSLDDMHQVVSVVQAAGAKFGGVGDIEQTQPVGRGAPMRAMIEQTGCVRMDKIIRQKVDWQREATLAMETQQTGEGLDAYIQHDQVHLYNTAEGAKAQIIEQWYAQYQQDMRHDLSQHILIVYKNETVGVLNQLARECLVRHQVLQEGRLFKTMSGEITVALGERLVFGKNDATLGVNNGQLGTVIAIYQDTLTVKIDGGQTLEFSAQAYRHFTHGYAATVHKLQGFTGDYAYEYIDGRGWDRHLFLVGSSRHRENLIIVADHEHFKDYADLKQVVSRYGLKDHIFDYPTRFAIRRGFEPTSIVKRTVDYVRQAVTKVQDGWLYLANYQAYLEKQNTLSPDPYETLQQQRRDAVVVADFCDNRLAVAEKIQSLTALSDEEKVLIQKEIYELQLKNSELAKTIQAKGDAFRVALDRNRIGDDAIEKSVQFGMRHVEIQGVIQQYQVSQFYNPLLADTIYSDLKGYYGHIVSQISDKEHLNRFMADIRQMAMQARYDKAFEQWGLDYRTDIKIIKQYSDLDYEITQALKNKDKALPGDQAASKEQLQVWSIERDRLAHMILMQRERYADLITHFDLKEESLGQHQSRYQDRALVKRFSELTASQSLQSNLYKQVLAHKIKAEPKRFGIYVNDFLKDGWKSINLENWHYERRQMILKASPAFKKSHLLVRRYFEAAYLARDAWQSAIKRRDKKSPHYAVFVKRAQALSYQRDKLASLLINQMTQHAGALAFDKVDLAKLSQRARHYDYFAKYIAETHEVRKLRMAHYISQNSKDFGHAIAVHHLYQDIKERARHFIYLQTVNEAPTQDMREAIRLAEQYYQKNSDARQAWGQAKALEKLGRNNLALVYEAKHLTYQRNKAAYDYLAHCAQANLVEPDIKGIELNYEHLQKAAYQHIAHERVIQYLNASTEGRGYLASELLKDRACYHFIYDKEISFKDLREEAKQWLNSQALAVQAANIKQRDIKRWNVEAINSALMLNPEDTYLAIFGEPKKRSAKEWRYENGLIVTIKGTDAGKWYSFSESKGGGPLKALQERAGLSFKQALEQGARLAKLSDAQAMTHDTLEIIQRRQPDKALMRDKQEAIERDHRIQSARSIWEKTQPLQTTLAERYFSEHRHITHLDQMAIRYWPVGSSWIDYNEDGKRVEKINKIPATVIAVKNAQGEITGIQRIYLDPKTAGKNTFMDNAKLSKGITQSAAGIIQLGQAGGRLYLAEGPETAASIASIDKEATVLASLSVSNLGNLADVVRYYAPSELIIAADNDGKQSVTRKTTEQAFAKLKAELAYEVNSIHVIYPPDIDALKKVDWNDVLIKQGPQALKEQLGIHTKGIKAGEYYYQASQPIAYTPAEHYLREVKGLAGVSLADVRYHPNVPLVNSDRNVPAIIVPAYNKNQQLYAEQILYLDNAGEKIIDTQVRGNAHTALSTIQPGQHFAVVYVTDNLIEAKSIAVGNTKAAILLVPNGYRDLSAVNEYLKQLPQKPGFVALATDNFTAENEKHFYALSEPLRQQGHTVMMVKGNINNQYTHTTINEALMRQTQFKGENYTHFHAIKAPVETKLSLKEKLAQAVKGRGKKIIGAPPVLEKRPEAITTQPYYLNLASEKIQAIKSYFASLDNLQRENSYQCALEVAKCANSTYTMLKDELNLLNKHPQHPQRYATETIAEIRHRVEAGQSIGLQDLSGLIKHITVPQFDTHTRQSLKEVMQLFVNEQQAALFKTKAQAFTNEKGELINAWIKENGMPSYHASLSLNDMKATLDKPLTRESFLSIVKNIQEVASDGKQQSLAQHHNKSHKKDDPSGGHSY